MAYKNPLLLATAIAHGVLSLGHTTKGLEQFKHPSLNTLPKTLLGACKAGWYEGSIFFAIIGILNYKWSQTGLVDMSDRLIASLISVLCLGAGVSYYRSGDKPSAVTLSLVAILQGVGARMGTL
ncbi:uncharacterized protein BDR25DRAFT_275270 [Lindgomyces ingoldianus]|uniref:Uncharacterized protein n=1 Tax=Lindgomyces ingoldianus TaxID=673940 RepID=A0ACB6RFJ9_9PLEO|nr:uncharacterized protein BDR25DRAFT_275270 [Lindgomyces ingoldianus]KAF2477825.1 hypothetical protein BDR25DRAFT_275270 [Lindgomyces ingoldianus]